MVVQTACIAQNEGFYCFLSLVLARCEGEGLAIDILIAQSIQLVEEGNIAKSHYSIAACRIL